MGFELMPDRPPQITSKNTAHLLIPRHKFNKGKYKCTITRKFKSTIDIFKIIDR